MMGKGRYVDVCVFGVEQLPPIFPVRTGGYDRGALESAIENSLPDEK